MLATREIGGGEKQVGVTSLHDDRPFHQRDALNRYVIGGERERAREVSIHRCLIWSTFFLLRLPTHSYRLQD
jgi:hypothetical protein